MNNKLSNKEKIELKQEIKMLKKKNLTKIEILHILKIDSDIYDELTDYSF